MGTNLSKIKREKMIDTLNNLKEKFHDMPEIVNTLFEIENELNNKKYGLVWEEHEERVDEELKTKIPVFKENKEFEIIKDSTKAINFLIEGDNLHSLYLLEKTYKRRVDVIYIDPPYNRGNKDFIYDDSYIDYENEYRHSKWLSFMKKRIEIAKQLLTENGVLFISIDDNEYANLKLICDDIFKEDFVETYIWCLQDKTEGSFVKTSKLTIRKEHEYIIACFNKKIKFNKYKAKRIFKKGAFKNPDNDPKGAWFSGNISRNGIKSTTGSKYYKIVTPSGKTFTRNWTLSQEEYNEKFKNGEIFFPKNGEGVPRMKIYEAEETLQIQSSLFTDVHTSITGKNELKALFDGVAPFDFPKPTSLIKRLIQISCCKKDSIILDFFAGSGTTGQAVLELNKEDNGDRQFILCTNNENEICKKITYVRLKRVIDGYVSNEGIASNLKYYETDFVERFKKEDDNYYIANELSKYVKELVQLENGIDISDESVQVIFDEEELDNLINNDKRLSSKCKTIYKDSSIILTYEQIKIFSENKINVIDIPEYYFENEIMEVEGW